ncbi:MAG: hypothetical protein AB1451_15575 [Nitrospirota bacterium]
MSWNMARLCGTLLGWSLPLLVSVAPADAGAPREWDFRDHATPSWSAAGDVASLRRTPEGLVVAPSGPAPAIRVSGLTISAADSAYALLRIQSPTPITEAYLAWSNRGGQRDTWSSRRFAIPREIRGGSPRSIWIRLDNMPGWSGTIESLAVAFVVGEDVSPVVVESISFLPDGFWSQVHRLADGIGLDDLAEDRAFPRWSLNTVGQISVGGRTVGGAATAIVCLGFAVFVVARLVSVRLVHSRRLTGVFLGALGSVAVLVGALDAYVGYKAFWVQWAVFGSRNPLAYYTHLDQDRLGLVAAAADLRGRLPSATELSICLPDHADAARFLWWWRLRYEFYPLRLSPDAAFILDLDDRSACRGPDDQLVLDGNGYRVVRHR